MPFNPELSDNVTAKEAGEKLREAAHFITEVRSKPVAEQTPELDSDVRGAIKFITEFDAVETALRRSETPEPQSQGPTVALSVPTQRSLSFAERITEDEGYQNFARSKSASSGFHEIKVEDSMFSRAVIAEGTITSGVGDGTGGSFLSNGQPIPPLVRQRRLFIRNLLSVATTGLSSIPYIQETTPVDLEGGASAVAENAAKPEVVMDWDRVDAPVRKVAAWIPVTTEIIEDAPTLQGYIEGRLLYMIALREEMEILAGDGTGAHIKGIRAQVGLQTQTAVTNDMPGTVALAIGKIENVDGEADGMAANPLDYWEAVASRHSTQFDNGYGGNAPALVSGLSWGLPVVRTRSMERGKFLVGDFSMGATLFDRQQASIRVGNQHSDYFTNNKVVVLGEERVALAVHRPDLFCLATYSAT